MKSKGKLLRVRKIKKWDFILVAAASTLVFCVMCLFFVQTSSAKKGQIELIIDVMDKTAANQKDLFETYVDDHIATLRTLATYPDVYEMDEDKQKAFIKGKSADWGFSHIFVMNMEGIGYYIEEGIHRDQSGEEFFFNIRKNEQYITTPFYQGNGTIIVTVCVSIYDPQGTKVGILCGAVKLSNIQELICENEVILDGNTYILESTGRYVTSQRDSDVYNKISIYDTPNSDLSLISSAFLTKSDMTGVMTLEGVEYQTRVTYLEDYDWLIVQNIPMANIVERYGVFNRMQYVLTVCVAILIFCIFRIVYSWKRSDQKIYTDQLTRCNSRAAFYDLMDYLQERYRYRITIVYMDLNRFKWVNDHYGHDKGDELLKIFSDVLISVLGKETFVARVGGDEFISVLIDEEDEKLFELWKQVERQLDEQSEALDFDYRISSAYGFASREKGEKDSLIDVMTRADEKMYEFKALQKVKEQ